MTDSRPVAADRIIFGTMRLLEAERTAEETADYLVELHELGIRSLHSSDEYASFPLLTSALAILARREPRRTFRHMVKLAEPSFDDDDRFSADRFSGRIDGYRRSLGVEHIDDVQWMWRRKVDDEPGRVSDFRRDAASIGDAVAAEKERGSIGRLFCFPYAPVFASDALDWQWVDGLAVYRNAEELEYDDVVDQAAAVGKAAIVIRPFFAGKLLKSRDPAALLAMALDKPAIEAAILSTNSLAHMKALLS